MRDGFIKVATAAVQTVVADVKSNTENIKDTILKADAENVNLLVFPELCITGYTCGDLFFNQTLISSAKAALLKIVKFTTDKYPVVVLGLPLKYKTKLYNCSVAISKGKILGVIPKTHIPDYSGFNEQRYFESGADIKSNTLNINDLCVDFGTDLIFRHNELNEFSFAVEICEDLFSPNPVNRYLSLGGANIIVNCAACNHTIGKSEFCKMLVKNTSAQLNCGYILSSCGIGESTGDTVFAGQAIIAENGQILAENEPFSENEILISEIDVNLLSTERQKNTSFSILNNFKEIPFTQEIIDTKITRHIEKSPFMPKGTQKTSYCDEVLNIQSFALRKRLDHTNSKKAVIGISGGLDSTLALLVTVRAMKLLGRSNTDILCVTMPCFGTTNRTKSNSQKLCEILGVDFKEIDISKSVRQHFEDIGHSESQLDTTYENSQARERTQVLMDIANKENGMVIGTGDLSELALGWATYNGDHMSMYAVNSGVPKTLIREIVYNEALKAQGELKDVLLDILDTPVSPELLPSDSNGNIAQKTEDLVGPYDLHDFFIFRTLKFGESSTKIFRLATIAFEEYDKATIHKWLTVFVKRFFTQQFKRSCMPDGPKVFSVSLSPRTDWKMPTDASYNLWLKELEQIKFNS